MNWKEKTVIRILLFVASMLSDEDTVKDELKSLSNHISFSGTRVE